MHRHPFFSRFCLFILSTCITLILCEGLARLFLPVYRVGPGLTQYDAVLGQVHKKNLRAVRWSPEFSITVSTNSLGFRGPDIEVPFPCHVPVLLFVGDSFTIGDGVNDGEEFPQLIAKRLGSEVGQPPIQVINAGIADSGTTRALKFLNWYAKEWKNPTVLIYQLFSNDFYDNTREGFYSLDSNGRLVERSGPAPKSLMRRLQPVVNSIPGFSRSYLIAGTRDMFVQSIRWGSSSGSLDSQTLRYQELLTSRLVEELARLARSNGWPLVGLVVGLSTQQEIGVRAIYDRFGATTVAVPDKSMRPDLYYKIDLHWHKRGHAYVAELLLPVIKAKIAKLRNARGVRIVEHEQA